MRTATFLIYFINKSLKIQKKVKPIIPALSRNNKYRFIFGISDSPKIDSIKVEITITCDSISIADMTVSLEICVFEKSNARDKNEIKPIGIYLLISDCDHRNAESLKGILHPL
ncbi:hypothetical protein LBMAG33_2920 [Candidatus Levyibacteriota bacterium]|nr:hypothetical protein LBMAG33_2920 [Candidatus Levybacteria bacterium]